MQGVSTETGVSSIEVIKKIQDLPIDQGGTGGAILGRELEREVGILSRTRNTKFTKILSEIGRSKPINALKTEYSEVDEYPLNVTVSEAVTPSYGSLIEVSLSQEDMRYVFVDETISFKAIPAYKDNIALPYRYLVGKITEKKSNGKIVVQSLNGYVDNNFATFKDAIPEGTIITRLSTAKKEWDISQERKNRFPQFNYNYVQKCIYQLATSSWEKKAKKDIDWELANQFKLAMTDEETRRELSYLLGVRGISYDPVTNEELYTCGGILEFITKHLPLNGALTNSSSTDAQKEQALEEIVNLLFDNNSGSDTRVAFLGTEFYSALNKIKIVQKQIDGSKEPYQYFGMNFRNITYNGFDLLLVRHPLLDFGGYGKAALCLDMENIEEHVFEQMEKIPLDLKKLGVADGEAFVIKRTACPVVKFPETHCLATL
jgi:hypothetical protein